MSQFIACSAEYLTSTFIAGVALGFAIGFPLSLAVIIWMERHEP